MQRIKLAELLKGVIIFLFFLFICLILFELFYRLFGFNQYTYMSPILQYDEGLDIIKLIPNSTGILQNIDIKIKIKSNSHGFRDIDRNYNKTLNRIAVVGDSFIFGHVEFNNTLSQNLQYILNNTEVLTFGLGSYDPNDYYNLITREVYKYNPDLIILSIYVGNDIRDLDVNRDLTVYDGYLVNKNSLKNLKSRIKFRLVIFLKRYVKSHFFFYNLVKKFGFFGDYYGEQKKISENYINLFSNNANNARNINQLNNLINNTNLFLKEKNISMSVILIPSKVQFLSNEEFKNKYIIDYFNDNITEFNIDLLFPQKLIIEKLNSSNISFIDLHNILIINNTIYYYNYDPHLTPIGNKVVAEVIADNINKEKYAKD